MPIVPPLEAYKNAPVFTKLVPPNRALLIGEVGCANAAATVAKNSQKSFFIDHASAFQLIYPPELAAVGMPLSQTVTPVLVSVDRSGVTSNTSPDEEGI